MVRNSIVFSFYLVINLFLVAVVAKASEPDNGEGEGLVKSGKYLFLFHMFFWEGDIWFSFVNNLF